MRRWIFFIFFSSLCLALPVCVKRLTHGFRIDKIKFELPFHAEWEISPLSPKSLDELLAIFSQPFYYLDRGAQSYVFQSEDERYVIKFFRMDRPRNPVRQWVREKIKKRSSSPRNFEKVDKLFSACKLAYTMAQEETELLYLHLNRTESLLPSLKLRSSLRQGLCCHRRLPMFGLW